MSAPQSELRRPRVYASTIRSLLGLCLTSRVCPDPRRSRRNAQMGLLNVRRLRVGEASGRAHAFLETQDQPHDG